MVAILICISWNDIMLIHHFLIDFQQGVLEAVRISLAGYPTRRSYSEFVDRFGLLAPDLLDGRSAYG